MLAGVEPGTGRVRALAVNRNFKLDDPDESAERDLHQPEGAEGHPGHLPEHHQPAAHRRWRHHRLPGRLDLQDVHHGGGAGEGLPAGVHDQRARAVYQSKYPVESGSPAACPGTSKYCPQNASNEHGRRAQHVDRASARSVNTYFVPLEERVGARQRRRRGQAARHPVPGEQRTPTWPTTEGGADQWGAFTLGVSATTPLDMANAYATLAADGKYCEPIPVQEIRDQSGKKLDVANPRCEQRVQAGRGPRRRRRGPLPGRRQLVDHASAAARTAGRRARHRRQAGRRQERHHRPERDRHAGRR